MLYQHFSGSSFNSQKMTAPTGSKPFLETFREERCCSPDSWLTIAFLLPVPPTSALSTWALLGLHLQPCFSECDSQSWPSAGWVHLRSHQLQPANPRRCNSLPVPSPISISILLVTWAESISLGTVGAPHFHERSLASLCGPWGPSPPHLLAHHTSRAGCEPPQPELTGVHQPLSPRLGFSSPPPSQTQFPLTLLPLSYTTSSKKPP